MIEISIIEDDKEIRESLAILIEGTEDFTCVSHFGSCEEALKSIELILASGPNVDLITRLRALEVKSDVLHNLGDYDACLSNDDTLLTLARQSQDENRLAEGFLPAVGLTGGDGLRYHRRSYLA